MNLAYRDIKHNLLRFVLTNFGLSLLLGIVIMMTGVYGGLIDDALRQARAANADIWVVEAGTKGPFAEASRIAGDTRELVSRVYGVQRAGSVTYQSVQAELNGAPLRLFLIGFLIYGPVMLIGVGAVDLVPKKAAGTAAGFTGLFGYMGGAVIAELGIGKVVQYVGWDGGIYLILVSCVLSIVLLAMTWKAHDRSGD